jgi:hypothetical protein
MKQGATALIASAPEAMHPVTREIILGGARTTSTDAFGAFYWLEDSHRAGDLPQGRCAGAADGEIFRATLCSMNFN